MEKFRKIWKNSEEFRKKWKISEKKFQNNSEKSGKNGRELEKFRQQLKKWKYSDL